MAFHYPTTPRTRNLWGKFAIVRHTLGLMSSIAAILFLSPPTVVIAQELGGSDQINVGIAKSASPQVRRNAEAEKGLKSNPLERLNMPIMSQMASQCVTAPQAPSTCAALRCQAKSWQLSFILTFLTARETANGSSQFFSTRIGWWPARLAITMIHAGE